MDRLTASAGRGGRHEHTLLLVFGDHGQVRLFRLKRLQKIICLRFAGVPLWLPEIAYIWYTCSLQTLGGDHGGGSPDEVDSALLAIDVGALQALRTLRASGAREALQNPTPIMPQVPHNWSSLHDAGGILSPVHNPWLMPVRSCSVSCL